VNLALFVSIFVIATCGLVYELVAGALASYLLGDSLLQFSTVIGTYLFAMGIGSYLSRFVGKGLITRFIQIEALLGVIGGFSAALLFTSFAYAAGFRVILYGLVIVIGTLVGMEIPLIMRILKEDMDFKDLIGQVLALDYLGALGASLLFPLFLVPHLGLLKTALVFGILNVVVGIWALYIFRSRIPRASGVRGQCMAALGVLVVGMAFSTEISAYAEGNMYADDVIFAKTSKYQRIVLTRWKDDLRLYLNANLQFSTRDEYRYHEALVHPGLAFHRAPKHVLVLGGGDGLAVREILRYPAVERITLVDLDPEMTKLFSSHPELSRVNGGALSSAKLEIVNADAFTWLEKNSGTYDFVVVDFPDPSNFSLGKLYSKTFYSLLRRRLNPGGLVSVQSTSPMFARKSYWSIERTLAVAGFNTVPYHAYVPSFGEWGFVLGATTPYKIPEKFPSGLRFLTPAVARGMFQFPKDMAALPVEANRLNTQVLVQYYEDEWNKIAPN
jgi:spermidine synthase